MWKSQTNKGFFEKEKDVNIETSVLGNELLKRQDITIQDIKECFVKELDYSDEVLEESEIQIKYSESKSSLEWSDLKNASNNYNL